MIRRGFAALPPERIREIGRMGGKAAHASGRGHRFTTEEARIAGKKGGSTPRRPRDPVPAQDPEETT